MIPKSPSSTPIGDGNRFPAFAKPASAGEGRSDKIMRKKADYFSMGKPTMLPHSVHEPS